MFDMAKVPFEQLLYLVRSRAARITTVRFPAVGTVPILVHRNDKPGLKALVAIFPLAPSASGAVIEAQLYPKGQTVGTSLPTTTGLYWRFDQNPFEIVLLPNHDLYGGMAMGASSATQFQVHVIEFV